MASPQWAMTQCGSSTAIWVNSFSASSYQKECRRATPRSKGFWTCGAQETGKVTVPSCAVVKSSWWWCSLSSSARAEIGESKKTRRRQMLVFMGPPLNEQFNLEFREGQIEGL